MVTVTLIMPLISATPRIQLQSLNAIIKVNNITPDCFLLSRTPLWRGRQKRLTVTDGCCYSILPLEATTVLLLPRHLSTISAMPRIQLRLLNATIKVNEIPPRLFSAKSNTPLRRKTQAPDSQQWSLLLDSTSWGDDCDFTSKVLINYLSYATDSAMITQCYNQG